jgi:hypothetical protein
MIIHRIFGLGRGVESLRALHAAGPIDRGHDARSSFGARASSAIRPTTPTRAARSFDASVDPTDARNDIVGCFGRSDQRAQAIVTCTSRTDPAAVCEYHGRRRSAGWAEDR